MFDPIKVSIDFVGNLPTPKNYRGYSFMDISIDAEPVGYDPLEGYAIYWGDGHKITCLIEDAPNNQEIPF